MKRVFVNLFAVVMTLYGAYMLGSMIYAGIRGNAYAAGYQAGADLMRERCRLAHAERLRTELEPVNRVEVALAARKYQRREAVSR